MKINISEKKSIKILTLSPAPQPSLFCRCEHPHGPVVGDSVRTGIGSRERGERVT